MDRAGTMYRWFDVNGGRYTMLTKRFPMRLFKKNQPQTFKAFYLTRRESIELTLRLINTVGLRGEYLCSTNISKITRWVETLAEIDQFPLTDWVSSSQFKDCFNPRIHIIAFV